MVTAAPPASRQAETTMARRRYGNMDGMRAPGLSDVRSRAQHRDGWQRPGSVAVTSSTSVKPLICIRTCISATVCYGTAAGRGGRREGYVIEFRVLGPLTVHRDQEPVALNAAMLRQLLVLLL